MPWGAVAGAAIGLVGDSMNKPKNGGAGTTSKEPWSAAEPWLLSNIEQGQALQQQLQAKPFSDRQNAAYDNTYALTDYQRQLTPSLLGQLSSSPMGYDPSNPTARPKAFNFGTGGSLGDTGDIGGGGLGGLLSTLGQQSIRNPTAPAAAAPAADSLLSGDYRALDPTSLKLAGGRGMLTGPGGAVDMTSNGGFGSFVYGSQPKPGTKEYRDMKEYLAWGGEDPYGMYGGESKYTAPGSGGLLGGQYST